MIISKKLKILVGILKLSSFHGLNSFPAFNLINEIDIPQTEARIAAYRAENAALIELNIQREEQYALSLKEREEYDRREREQRALEARKEEEDEKAEREKERREIIDRLETSDKDASRVIAKSRADALKRSSARTSSTHLQSNPKLIRSRAVLGAAIPDVPHIPLQDDWYMYEDMFVLRENYNDPSSEAVRKDREGIMRAGGYRVEEAWERAVRSAMAGLDMLPLSGIDVPGDALRGSLDNSEDVVMASA
jgi:CDK-activating kinase assembly factor MAT1